MPELLFICGWWIAIAVALLLVWKSQQKRNRDREFRLGDRVRYRGEWPHHCAGVIINDPWFLVQWENGERTHEPARWLERLPAAERKEPRR